MAKYTNRMTYDAMLFTGDNMDELVTFMERDQYQIAARSGDRAGIVPSLTLSFGKQNSVDLFIGYYLLRDENRKYFSLTTQEFSAHYVATGA